MSNIQGNPCLACITGQHCCSRLSGLVLSADEFRLFFEGHRKELSIKQSNKAIIVSSINGNACPHWGESGCRIYLHRPIDCRVFPYVTARIIEKRSTVKIVFHSRSDCPLKNQLYRTMPEADIRNLLTELGKSVYGSAKSIVVQHERGYISRLQNRIEAAISRRLYQTGHK
ncbi:MAG: YkgJ family cysteine cluster protein [Desulfuromonadales bacterium]|nr:YkgJ family cysteine cluster protein [Desulfuromonadales bacterium]